MLKGYLIFTLFSGELIRLNLGEDIHKRIDRIKERGRQLYGDRVKTEWSLWELENDDMNGYPRGEKQKKALFMRQWIAYYECTARHLESVMTTGRVPSQFVAVYEGAVAAIQCDKCIAPDEDEIEWVYAKSLKKLFYANLQADPYTVLERGGLMTIYSARKSHALVYRCHTALHILHVTADPYSLVKPATSNGPNPAPAVTIDNVTVWTKWGTWSECSCCGTVGRKRKYGMCFVTVDFDEIQDASKNDTDIAIFKDFPKGIPCGSEYLPASIRNMSHVQNRKNEIMLAMCKVPCRTKMFEIRAADGTLLERVNNSAGEFSLLQRLPPQPPMPIARVLFADSGESRVLTCPSTAFIDSPLTWRVGAKIAAPQTLERDSDGDIYIDARDRIVFNKLKADDANIYSCWVRSQAVGTVKLHVWSGPQSRLERDTIAILLIILTANILSLLRFAVRSARRDLACDDDPLYICN